jgi:hypothetical protein
VKLDAVARHRGILSTTSRLRLPGRGAGPTALTTIAISDTSRQARSVGESATCAFAAHTNADRFA